MPLAAPHVNVRRPAGLTDWLTMLRYMASLALSMIREIAPELRLAQ
jgi:hypothetical protein